MAVWVLGLVYGGATLWNVHIEMYYLEKIWEYLSCRWGLELALFMTFLGAHFSWAFSESFMALRPLPTMDVYNDYFSAVKRPGNSHLSVSPPWTHPRRWGSFVKHPGRQCEDSPRSNSGSIIFSSMWHLLNNFDRPRCLRPPVFTSRPTGWMSMNGQSVKSSLSILFYSHLN